MIVNPRYGIFVILLLIGCSKVEAEADYCSNVSVVYNQHCTEYVEELPEDYQHCFNETNGDCTVYEELVETNFDNDNIRYDLKCDDYFFMITNFCDLSQCETVELNCDSPFATSSSYLGYDIEEAFGECSFGLGRVNEKGVSEIQVCANGQCIEQSEAEETICKKIVR